jgi:hypothetical protein
VAATPVPPAMMACTEGLRGAMSLLNALSCTRSIPQSQQRPAKEEEEDDEDEAKREG